MAFKTPIVLLSQLDLLFRYYYLRIMDKAIIFLREGIL